MFDAAGGETMTRQTRQISRRSFLGTSVGLVGVSLLAACAPSAPAPAPTQPPAPKPTEAPKPAEAAKAPAATAAPAPTQAPAAPKPTEAAAPKPAAAKPAAIPRVRVGLSGQVVRLDPATPLTAPSYQAIVLTVGQLYRYDQNRQPVPDLVERSDVSPDGLTIRMTLKPGLVYSDGAPVKAEDAVFSLERQRKAPGAFLFTPVEAAEAADDRTIVWKMKAPYPDFFSALAFQYLVLHPKAKVEADTDYFTHPVSAGPYVVKEWTPGTPRMLLEANPRYVGGALAIQEIELVSVPDLTSRVLQLTTGALNWAFDLPASAMDSLPREVSAVPHPIAGMYHVTINLEKPGPLADPKVRQAISLAINRDEVNQKAFFGISKPASAFLFTGVPEHTPILPNEGKRDLEGAKRLLASTPHAQGFEFSLQTWGARPGWKEAALVIAENLKELGITAKVDPIEDAVASANLVAGNFDAQFSGNTGIPIFFLKNQFTPGTFWGDAARYNKPEVTTLLEQASTELDAAKRKDLLTQVQKLAYEDLPHIPISERVVLTGSRLQNDVLTAVKPGEYLLVKTAAQLGG
jgi:peptide/nickel transport system substrate-binding protein